MSRFGTGLFEDDITTDVLEVFIAAYNREKDKSKVSELKEKLRNETLGFTKEISEEMSAQILAFAVMLKNYDLIDDDMMREVKENIDREEYYWDIKNIEEVKSKDIFRIGLINSLKELYATDKSALENMTPEEKADEMLSSKYNKKEEDLKRRKEVHKKVMNFLEGSESNLSKEELLKRFNP